jgi:hypothetical protein
MATNTVKVELVGHDKSLGKTLKKSGADVHTFSGKLKMVGMTFRSLIRGDFKKAGGSLKTLAGGFGKMGAAAGIGIGAVIVGFGAMLMALHKCMAAYSNYMQQIVKVKRFTGMTTAQTSLLVNEMRLSGVEAGKGANGLKFFAKNLDAAQQGSATMVDTFKRLNVDLKDANGNWRDGSDVLADARDRLSEMKDGTEKTALATRLFGRGGADLLPWLSKSVDKMREYDKWTRQLGLVMGEKSLKAFSEYRENQRKLSIGWDAIKINAAGALVPLINDLMPPIIKLIWTAAHWVGKFRQFIDKEGWGKAFDKMVPGGRKIRDYVKLIWEKAKAFGQYIIEHRGEILNAFKNIATVCDAIADALGAAVKFARYIANLTQGQHGSGSRTPMSGKVSRHGDPSAPGIGGGSLGMSPPSLGASPGGSLADGVWAWLKKILGGMALPGMLGGEGYGWAASLARRFGLTVTSTFRPGAITAAGYPSNHATYGRAADIAGSPGAMASLWRFLVANRGAVREGIYQHQMIKNGALMGYGPSDHYDHVHVARAGDNSQRGGDNQTRVVNVYLDGTLVARKVMAIRDTVMAQRGRRR